MTKTSYYFQNPWALRLLIVQESAYASLKSKLTARIKSLKTGSTFEKMADVSNSIADKSICKRLQEMLTIDPSSEASALVVYLNPVFPCTLYTN